MENKTIIITGASSGIGAAAARLFAEAGANVILAARGEGRLTETAAALKGTAGTVRYLPGDVRDETYARDLVRLAETEFGGLDGAFNNAGMMGELSPVADMDDTNWRAVIDTNLTSAFFAAKYQIPAIKRSGGGAILFTSSFVGARNSGLNGMSAYAASKAGLIGLVRSLANEHGVEGIRINALLPGGTKTEMAGSDPDALRYVAGLHSLGRMAEPEEIASVAAFLLSDAASFIAGSAVMADGGASIRFG